MKTRDQYIAHACSHDEYYADIAQALGLGFKESSLLPRVIRALESGDEHLNTIPLSYWDALAMSYVDKPHASKVFKERGDWPTLSSFVCALKAAAKRDAKEAHEAKD